MDSRGMGRPWASGADSRAERMGNAGAGRRRDERPRRPAQEAGQRGRGHRGRPETGRKDRDVRSGIERQTAGRLRQKSRNVVRVPD